MTISLPPEVWRAIFPSPTAPPTRLERFLRGFATPTRRLAKKIVPQLAPLEWEYPRLDRFIRSARAKGYTDDQIEEGIKLLVDEMAERMARRKGLKVEQVKPVLEEVLKEPVGPERWGREAFKFGVLAAGTVPTAGMSLPLAAATEGALFAGLETLGKVALGEEVTPKGMAESFALGAVFPPLLRGAGRLWRAIRGMRPPVTAVEEAEVLAKRMEDVAEQLAKRIETPEDYDDLLSAITEVFPTEAPERAMAEVAEVAGLVPRPKILAEEAPERVLEELEVITGGIPRAPVREVALPKPPVGEVAKKPYEELKPGTTEWMRVWREHPELQREMLEYRRRFVPEEMVPPKPKMAPLEVPKEPKVEVPKVGEKGPKEVPKPPVERKLSKSKPPAKKAKQAVSKPTVEVGKEPWEMTREEWNKVKRRLQREWKKALSEGDYNKAAKLEELRTRHIYNVDVPSIWYKEAKGKTKFDLVDHKMVVEQALKEGKPIPPEVLKDYPNLAEMSPLKPKIVSEAKWQHVESYSRLKPGDYIRVHYRGKTYEGRISGKPKRMRSGAVMVPLEGGNRKWAPWTPMAKYERKVE